MSCKLISFRKRLQKNFNKQAKQVKYIVIPKIGSLQWIIPPTTKNLSTKKYMYKYTNPTTTTALYDKLYGPGLPVPACPCACA